MASQPRFVVVPSTVSAAQGLEYVQQSPLFANLSQKDREQIIRAAQRRTFAKDETIHVEGEPVRQFVLLTFGSAKLRQFSQNGNEVILRLCGPGETVGSIVSTSATHGATAQTLQPSEALIWPIGAFDLLSQRFPKLKLNGLLILDEQLKEMEERFREISTESVSSRLSHQLIRMLNQFGNPENGSIQFRISKEELAQLIGTTLYTVSRVLSGWQRRGIVRTQREEVTIQSVRALQSVSEEACF